MIAKEVRISIRKITLNIMGQYGSYVIKISGETFVVDKEVIRCDEHSNASAHVGGIKGP